MAELVDALASGASFRKEVGVRVPLRAHMNNLENPTNQGSQFEGQEKLAEFNLKQKSIKDGLLDIEAELSSLKVARARVMFEKLNPQYRKVGVVDLRLYEQEINDKIDLLTGLKDEGLEKLNMMKEKLAENEGVIENQENSSKIKPEEN